LFEIIYCKQSGETKNGGEIAINSTHSVLKILVGFIDL
jgi:hypothetical protein